MTNRASGGGRRDGAQRGARGEVTETAARVRTPLEMATAGPLAETLRAVPSTLLPLDDAEEDLTDEVEDDETEEAEAEEEAEEAEAVEEDESVDDSVRLYLREIGRVRLLTAADERRLGRQIEEGRYLEMLERSRSEAMTGPLHHRLMLVLAEQLPAAQSGAAS